MAEQSLTTPPAPPLAGFELGNVLQIPAVRQLTLLIGVAASVAAGAAVFFWAQTPDMRPLYSDLTADDAAAIVTALNGAGIDNRLDGTGTRVLVPPGNMHAARLELAGQGLPESTSVGAELLAEQPSFGVSQFMESARYQQALEGELARTIRNLHGVTEARVHLALPRQTAFLRDRNTPSASVMVALARGRSLEPEQTRSIVHLVASSIPNLAATDVTVIDQQGRLLTDRDGDSSLSLSAAQFDYTETLQSAYRQRIVELLTPLVGVGNVRAEVVADLDFTVTEETRERYDPDINVVRSESINEQQRSGSAGGAAGVPGALSNQPPETGGVVNPEESAEAEKILNSSRSATRNFELDKTVSVIRQPVGAIERLSVAVLVAEPADAAATDGGDGAAIAPEDIELYTTLVREAVGFDPDRGDSVSVVAAPFLAEPGLDEAASIPIWQRPDVLAVVRNVIGILVVLAIAFGIGRPLLRGLVTTNTAILPSAGARSGELLPAGSAAARQALPQSANYSYEQKVAAAKNITGHDPARVAQVLKKWVSDDE